MTAPLDIDALDALLAATSPAPWEVKRNAHDNLDGSPWGWIKDNSRERITWSGYLARDNAAALVALRNAAPLLLACWRAAAEYARDFDPWEHPDSAELRRLRAIVNGEEP